MRMDVVQFSGERKAIKFLDRTLSVQLGCWGEVGEECLRFYDYDHDETVGRCWIFRFSN